MNFQKYRSHILLALAILAFIGMRAYRNHMSSDEMDIRKILEPQRNTVVAQTPTPAPAPESRVAAPTSTPFPEEAASAPGPAPTPAQPCGPGGCETSTPTPTPIVMTPEQIEKEKREAAQKRLALLTASCEKNDTKDCLELGRIYVDQKDPAKAFEFLRKSCRLGRAEEVCAEASAVMTAGNSQIVAKGCADGDPKDCFLNAILLYREGKKEEGIRLGTKACREGMLEACGVVGETMSTNDYIRASDSCKTGDVDSCLLAGGYEKSQGRLKDAQARLSSACEAGNDRSCFASGEVNGGAEDLSSLKDQCNAGKKNACLKLAGIEAEKDAENTDETKYMQLACRAGSQQACDILKKIGK